MPFIQIIFFCSISVSILVLILNIVRKRMLREPYSLLWIFIAVMLLVVVAAYPLLVLFSNIFDATPTSMLIFLGMIALLLMILQVAIFNSKRSIQVKNLSQKIALLEQKLDQLSQKSKQK